MLVYSASSDAEPEKQMFQKLEYLAKFFLLISKVT